MTPDLITWPFAIAYGLILLALAGLGMSGALWPWAIPAVIGGGVLGWQLRTDYDRAKQQARKDQFL